jgi:hypothetical protein
VLSSIRDTNDISSPRYTHTLGWGADPLFSCHQRSGSIQLESNSPAFGAHRRECSKATLRKVGHSLKKPINKQDMQKYARIIPIIKDLVVNDRKSTYCKLGDACDVVRRKTCQHKK